ADPSHLPSLPTRRSSDLDPDGGSVLLQQRLAVKLVGEHHVVEPDLAQVEVVVVGSLGGDEMQRARSGEYAGVSEQVVEADAAPRSEEHTSELQSRGHLVC